MRRQTTSNLVAFGLITTLFFAWALIIQLTPILIPHLKKACQLSDFQSAWIDSAVFVAYFIMAIPAGIFMEKFGYQRGILAGLSLFALGAFLMWPAAGAVSYPLILGALFVVASGLAFLETAANPYATVLGPPETAAFRLNFAQSFNGLGSALAPLLGGLFILSQESEYEAARAAGGATFGQFLQHEAEAVQIPFLSIGIFVGLLAVLFSLVRLPDLRTEKPAGNVLNKIPGLLRIPGLRAGVAAQFFYVGAQVCVSSFFIRFAKHTAGIDAKEAAGLLSFALLLFMIGRFVGTFLMRYVEASRLLTIYGVLAALLLAVAVFSKGPVSVNALMGVEFFFSIMFPTIFSLGVAGLGEEKKLASSLIIMAIVGGAIIPLCMGKVSDRSNIQLAYLTPMVCLLPVIYFGWKSGRRAVVTP